jgi:hypothetical protein
MRTLTLLMVGSAWLAFAPVVPGAHATSLWDLEADLDMQFVERDRQHRELMDYLHSRDRAACYARDLDNYQRLLDQHLPQYEAMLKRDASDAELEAELARQHLRRRDVRRVRHQVL